MRKFVKQIAKVYAADEGALQGFRRFYSLRNDPGWTEFIKMLHLTQGLMAQELLSDKFTEKNREDKDILQRTFANLRYFMEFLENPLPELQRAMFLAGHKEATTDRVQRQKSKSVPATKGR